MSSARMATTKGVGSTVHSARDLTTAIFGKQGFEMRYFFGQDIAALQQHSPEFIQQRIDVLKLFRISVPGDLNLGNSCGRFENGRIEQSQRNRSVIRFGF